VTGIRLRLYASAREAAGVDELELRMPPGSTVADALDRLAPAPHQPLDRVLSRCSFLLDGVATSDRGVRLDGATTLDVLPPFAGG